MCREAVSGDEAQILREVAGATVHVKKAANRWQRINKDMIKTRPKVASELFS